MDDLVAHHALTALVHRYTHAGDTGRFDDLVACFTPDGTLTVDDRPPCAGRDAIRAFLRGTGDAAVTAPRMRHHLTTMSFTLEGDDTATGTAYFQVTTERGLDHWGRYRDRYVRTPEGWRFAARHVRVDGVTPGGWAATRRGGG